MANIQKETAEKLAYAYRDVEAAEELLNKIGEALAKREEPDVRDAFGRRRGGLELGVPHGTSGTRTLYDVPWKLAKPILEAYIASKRAEISALSVRAQAELDLDRPQVQMEPPPPEWLGPVDFDPTAHIPTPPDFKP